MAIGALLVAVLAGTGGARWHHNHFVPRHLRTVDPDVLYRCAWPTADQLDTVVARYGIRTVVNLCLPGEEISTQDGNWEREAEQCRRLGITLVHLPLPGNTPPDAEQAAAWLRLFESPDRLPVLVHCAQGVIRTNGLVAVYRIGVQGRDNRTVLHSLPDFGHDLFSVKRHGLNEFILAPQPDNGAEANRTGATPAGNGCAQ